MYWTDGERNSIEVADLNGTNRKVLIWDDLDTPRALALHYHHGLMFWSDWGTNAKIEVAEMDGTNRKKLITENLIWPNGLAVDRPTGRLYWNDAKLNTIESSDLHGNDRRTIITGVLHPYGLVVVGNHVYWTDWQTKALHRVEKTTGSDNITVIGNLEGLMDIRSVQTENIGENACGENNGGCSHLCLRNAKSYTCACPTGLKMSKHNNKSCNFQPDNYLLITSRAGLTRISLDSQEYWDVTLPINDIINAIDVDFHWRKQLIFYTDTKSKQIRSVDTRNFSNNNVVIFDGISESSSIAVDWIADNLYWVDARSSYIEVAKLDGGYRKVVVSENVYEPMSITVFPRKGYLFWADWSTNTKIERAFTDGSSRKTLIDTDLGLPNGLVVDYVGKRLYWTDAKLDRIENSDLNGRNRIQLVHARPNVHNTHPFGLAIVSWRWKQNLLLY